MRSIHGIKSRRHQALLVAIELANEFKADLKAHQLMINRIIDGMIGNDNIHRLALEWYEANKGIERDYLLRELVIDTDNK